MEKKDYWDDIFLSKGIKDYNDSPPSPELLDIIKLIKSGSSVLDLGCGMGKSDILLSECGFDVTAVDFSEVAIKSLESECKRRNVKMDARVQDLCDFRFEWEYDLIIAHGSLQFLERRCWERLIAEAKAHTNPGGVNFVAVFTDTVPTPDDMAETMGDVFREGELFELYHDWSILSQESYIKEDEHPGGIRHRHPINKIIARKGISTAKR
ncbi:MAG: methyltransferase domain-containing protein [Methanobacteriota archaeon]